ncbi:MAG: [FeFe] hydrogenase H-cluster maturation GTPase HydF [Oscillospiraceae bacterium]
MSLNSTPNSNRLHIGIYGKRNSGKSTLINAITNQESALVSNVAGTTTDPVYKAMEVRGIGACVFIDTAGFDDVGDLGKLRLEKTELALQKTDIAIMVFTDENFSLEKVWLEKLKQQNTPVIAIVNKSDIIDADSLSKKILSELKLTSLIVSGMSKDGVKGILSELVRHVPADYDMESITGHLVNNGDVVMLVMPQDSEAPKGRLILPQVQTTRDLLDNHCVIISCTPDTFDTSLASLKAPPNLIITDSQVFHTIYQKTPKESRLTSFSVLLAASKGDLREFISAANTIDNLSETSHILIAEACTHAPLSEDIGRVKIPMMLKKKYGDTINVTIVSGTDFPKDLSPYDLIIHCGGCMFNKKYLMSRISAAKNANVPITNYGILIAKLNGILDKITY